MSQNERKMPQRPAGGHMRGGPPGMMIGEKAKDFKGSFKKFLLCDTCLFS